MREATWVRVPCPKCNRGHGDTAGAVRDDGFGLCHRCGHRWGVRGWVPPPPSPGRKTAAADLLSACSPIAEGDLADRYLRRRGYLPPWPADLLSSPRCPHPSGRTYPAMVARVRDISGGIVAAHRTYLDDSGHKADTDPQRAAIGPVRGAAIRLSPRAAIATFVEGIEDGLAVLASWPGDSPTVYACLSANGLRHVDVSREHTAFLVCPDRDAVGAAAGRDLYERLHDQGWAGAIAWPSGKDPDEDHQSAA